MVSSGSTGSTSIHAPAPMAAQAALAILARESMWGLALKQSYANSISTCDNARCSWHPAVLPRCSKLGVATSVRRSTAFVGLLACCSCHGSISGRELSFLSDFVHACAVGYHTARFVAGMRADALRQWGSGRSRFKRTVRVRSQSIGNRV